MRTHGNPKASANDLEGDWTIIYLDSYEDSYVGSFEEIEKLNEYIYSNEKEKWSSLEGTDFAAEDWLGKTVCITRETFYLSEWSFQIMEVEESSVSRENFEKEMRIHDGLSMYDDKIKVCNIKCSNSEDIICVLAGKDKIIMHIEQGWFMLNRQK